MSTTSELEIGGSSFLSLFNENGNSDVLDFWDFYHCFRQSLRMRNACAITQWSLTCYDPCYTFCVLTSFDSSVDGRIIPFPDRINCK